LQPKNSKRRRSRRLYGSDFSRDKQVNVLDNFLDNDGVSYAPKKTSVNPRDKPRDSATATSHEKGQIPHLGFRIESRYLKSAR
jgi:hypothetical protein